MPRPFAVRWSRIAHVLAIVALLQPLLLAIDPGAAGWRPDHLHVRMHGAGPLEAAHAHPYDRHSEDGSARPQPGDESGGVAFVTPDFDSASVVAPPLGPNLTIPLAHPADPPSRVSPLVALRSAPEPPPPRA